jgi:hypothetical protein
MAEHPAHGLAAMAENAAEELRGYVNPADPFPRELTGADHLDLLPRLCSTVSQLAGCIASLAEVTADETARHWLAEGAKRIESGYYAVQVGYNLLADNPSDQPGPARSDRARTVQVSASKTAEGKENASGRRTPQALAAEGFPYGPAAGRRPDSDAGTSSDQSARRQPDQSPLTSRGRGRRR